MFIGSIFVYVCVSEMKFVCQRHLSSEANVWALITLPIIQPFPFVFLGDGD